MDLTAKYAQLLLGNKLLGVIEGGNSNLKSTYNGVKFASKYLKDEDILLTHDITNSSVDNEAIKMVIEAAKNMVQLPMVQSRFKHYLLKILIIQLRAQ